ncbi:MAG: hypothetical protein ACKO4Q_08700 [Planctomycetota bacterium]
MVSSMQLLEESPATLLDEPLLVGITASVDSTAQAGDYDFEDDFEDEDDKDDDEDEDEEDDDEDDDEDDEDRDLWDDKDEDDE